MKTQLAILITVLTLTGLASAADNGVKVLYNSKGGILSVQRADVKPLFGSKSNDTMKSGGAVCIAMPCCAKK